MLFFPSNDDAMTMMHAWTVQTNYWANAVVTLTRTTDTVLSHWKRGPKERTHPRR